jgi:hypothetical protein
MHETGVRGYFGLCCKQSAHVTVEQTPLFRMLPVM